MRINFERAFQWGVVAAASAVLLGVFAMHVKAADLGGSAGGYKDGPAESIPGVNWSGVYVGGLLGYGSGRATLGGEVGIIPLETTAGIHTDTSLTGFVGGLTVGADWHVPSSRWVFGLYGDYVFGDRTGDILGATFNKDEIAVRSKLSNQWALGGRAGVLVTPGTLVFVKAGYTQADEAIDITGFGSSANLWKATKGGYEIGGGFESSLGSNFFLRGEYDYSDYGSSTIASTTVPGVGSFKLTDDFSDNRFMAGVVYKFGMGR